MASKFSSTSDEEIQINPKKVLLSKTRRHTAKTHESSDESPSSSKMSSKSLKQTVERTFEGNPRTLLNSNMVPMNRAEYYGDLVGGFALNYVSPRAAIPGRDLPVVTVDRGGVSKSETHAKRDISDKSQKSVSRHKIPVMESSVKTQGFSKGKPDSQTESDEYQTYPSTVGKHRDKSRTNHTSLGRISDINRTSVETHYQTNLNEYGMPMGNSLALQQQSMTADRSRQSNISTFDRSIPIGYDKLSRLEGSRPVNLDTTCFTVSSNLCPRVVVECLPDSKELTMRPYPTAGREADVPPVRESFHEPPFVGDFTCNNTTRSINPLHCNVATRINPQHQTCTTIGLPVSRHMASSSEWRQSISVPISLGPTLTAAHWANLANSDADRRDGCRESERGFGVQSSAVHRHTRLEGPLYSDSSIWPGGVHPPPNEGQFCNSNIGLKESWV